MSSSEKESIGPTPVETQVLHVTKKQEYSLDALNNYGDNLLHLSAANDCHNIMKDILKTRRISEINQKNDCEWTPLMQAIRNGNVEAVKILLANGYSPDEYTFKDISPIGLAAAMGLTMFETVYNACPAALEHAKYNNISPLCAAVIREDKQLLFRLLELGVDVSEAAEYTLMLMKQSRLPEIVELAKVHCVTEDYWTENWDTMECFEYLQDKFQDPLMSSTLDNIESSVDCHQDNVKDAEKSLVLARMSVIPAIDKEINKRRNFEALGVNVFRSSDESQSLISPRLSYIRKQTFPVSPTPNPLCLLTKKEENSEMSDSPVDDNSFKDFHNDFIDSASSDTPLNSTFNDESKMHRYKINRPPDLKISQDDGVDSVYSLEHEKSKSTVTSCKTPMEPRYETPSAAMILDLDQKKMAVLLQRFGLTRFIFTFLAQEVDLELFLTLNDQDLREIGIESKSDRNVLLSVIAECNRCNM